MANIPIVNLNGGEFTPQIDCRSDTEKYNSGCRHLENFLPRIYGGAERRPGTKFVASTIDFDSVLPTILAYENVEACWENLVVTTGTSLVPVFACYENLIICYENKVVIGSETIELDSIACYENSVMFYENKILTYN